MGLTREKIEKGKIRKLFPKARAGVHKYMKKCMNRIVRHQAKKIRIDDESNVVPKKKYRGWEY